MIEQEAIACMKQGNIMGLQTIVNAYQLKAVRAAYLITQEISLAEEVVQDSFLVIYERIDQFDDNYPFAPWFFRVVTNNAIKAVKKRSRWLSLDMLLTLPMNTKLACLEAFQSRPFDLDEFVATKMTQETMREALNQLSPKQRAVVVLRYFLDMSDAQIADDLKIAPGTVKWRLHAARTRLRLLLGSE